MVVRVVVVGGGVSGVGSALAILQRLPSCNLTIIAEHFTPNTTGDGAAGFWEPHLTTGTPQEKIMSGFSFGTVTAEPLKFLPVLLEEVRALGGSVKMCRLTSLAEAAAEADIVINCSGLGARKLVPDPEVYPCRGQVMRVRAPWVGRYLCDASKKSFAYIIPNLETVVLGGTNQDHDWRLEVDPTDSQTIWDNCTALMPSLKKAEVIKEWVGLRPCRESGVRLEADELQVDSRIVPVVHNYGHGGSGVTLFWGCSKEVADIACDLIHKHYGLPSRL
ncbi:D-aspartate oxidase isoform X3 [Cherax quadricarinatus]|uniref:D-aspartate oxidase isoform X3 n=1 Tax=Cherax quadricarinatus TaxID=27406 RepID=UPI00387E40CD